MPPEEASPDNVDEASASPSKHRKMRASCDSCHAAKVKCAKEQPVCSRCAKPGSDCVYSYSRRAGKPKGSGKGILTSSRASPALETHRLPASIPPSTASQDMDYHMRDQSWNTDFPWDSGFAGTSTTSIGFHAGAAESHSSASHGVNPINTDQTAELTTFGPSFDPICNPQALGEDHATSEDAVFSALNGDLFEPLSDLSPSWTPWSNSSMSTDGRLAMKDRQSSDFIAEHLDGGSTAKDGNHTCGCSAKLQETLQTLECPSVSFDKLLAVNKSAVSRANQQLFCRCPPDMSSIMLLSAIIMKMVQFYEKARHEQGQGAEEVGVTLGTLKMDGEDEYEIRMLLIRSELRKIHTLIAQFRERFERYLDAQGRHVLGAIIAFMETRLRETVNGL